MSHGRKWLASAPDPLLRLHHVLNDFNIILFCSYLPEINENTREGETAPSIFRRFLRFSPRFSY